MYLEKIILCFYDSHSKGNIKKCKPILHDDLLIQNCTHFCYCSYLQKIFFQRKIMLSSKKNL